MLFLLLLFSFFLCIENSTFIEPFHAGHSCFAFVFECKSHPSFLRFPSLTHQRFQRKFDLKAPGVRVSSRYELPGSQAQKVQAITANGARMWRRALRMSAELSPEEQTERAQSTAMDPTAPSAAPPGTRRRNRKPKPPPADPFAPPPGPESFPPYAPRDFFRYELIHQSSRSNARVGRIHTPHGVVDTPGFVPVATAAALKAVDVREMDEAAGQQLMFCNTYHLLLQPGPDVVAAAGGLHRFMGRDPARPLITDSGGFQAAPPPPPPPPNARAHTLLNPLSCNPPSPLPTHTHTHTHPGYCVHARTHTL